MAVNTRFALLLAAYVVSAVGDWVFKLAVPLFVFEKTGSPMAMALAYALTFLPYLLATPVGGALADRVDRRRLLIRVDAASTVLAFAIAAYALWYPGWMEPFYVLIVCLASFSSLYHPAFQSFIPMIVARDDLARANSYVQASDNLIHLVGPLAGGGLIAAVGAVDAMLANAVTFALSGALILAIRMPGGTAAQRAPGPALRPLGIAGIAADMRDGLACAFAHDALKYSAILALFANFGTNVLAGSFMYFLVEELRLGPDLVGLTFALSGLGALAGSLGAPRIARLTTPGRLALCSILGAGLATLGLVWARDVATVALLRGLSLGLLSMLVVTMFTLRQQLVPPSHLGRTVAATRTMSFATIPFAAYLGGSLLERTGDINGLIVLSGGTLLATGIAGLFTPLGWPRRATGEMTGEMTGEAADPKG